MTSRYIPFSALFRFASLIYAHGGVHYSKIQRLSPYITRSILFEPFCWVETLAMERKIQKHQIEQPPVFVLGHWRSGTTFTQRLLVQDPRFGYLNIYKAIFPQMYFGTEKAFTPFFQTVVNTINAKNPFHNLRINWKEAAEEDDTAFLGLISPHTSYWGLVFPHKFKDLLQKYTFTNAIAKDVEKWKADYLYLVKKLSLYNGNKPLVFKSPPNTARIKQLVELFPDAKFIYVHRNPYEVFNSTRGLWRAHMKNFALYSLTQKEIDERILYGYELLVSSYMEQRSLIPEKNLIEVRYEELFENPIDKMQEIYGHLSLPAFSEVKDKLHSFVQKHKFKEPTKYEFAPDIIEKVNTAWDFSLKEWAYDEVEA